MLFKFSKRTAITVPCESNFTSEELTVGKYYNAIRKYYFEKKFQHDIANSVSEVSIREISYNNKPALYTTCYTIREYDGHRYDYYQLNDVIIDIKMPILHKMVRKAKTLNPFYMCPVCYNGLIDTIDQPFSVANFILAEPVKVSGTLKLSTLNLNLNLLPTNNGIIKCNNCLLETNYETMNFMHSPVKLDLNNFVNLIKLD